MSGTLLVSGLGLMGGSLAAAASAAGWRVLLHHRRPEPIAEAAARGWGKACPDLAGAAGADLAVVCTPVEHLVAGVRAVAAVGVRVVSDVGSVKGGLCRELADIAGFVGSHPMCGSHRQGLAHADPLLYRGATTIVTPLAGSSPATVAQVEGLWTSLGCRLLRLTPEAHDAAVAVASHLPHVLANAAARRLSPAAAPLCAGGFRDVTRVAGGGTDLWAGILLANRDEVAAQVRASAAELTTLAEALEAGDEAAVRAWLAAGHAGRALYEAARNGAAARG